MHRVVVRPAADIELMEARLWYEEQREDLGTAFYNAVAVTIWRIAEAPLAFPMVHKDTRRARVHRFPYGVYFKADDATVYVIAIVHNSRHPNRWRSRS